LIERVSTTPSKAHLQHATWPVILFCDGKVFKTLEPLALVISKARKASVIQKQPSTQARLGLPNQLPIIAAPTVNAYAVQTHTVDLILGESNECRSSAFPFLSSMAIRH
jgi:hypothetical protein